MENESNNNFRKDSGRNPWLSIWTEPRATIARIIQVNPNRGLWWLAAIYGFSSLLNSFQSVSFGHRIGLLQIFILALVLSPIWGYLGFSIWSYFVLIAGKLFGGKGSFKEIRAAYAWSCVPLLFNACLWIVLALCFGNALFMSMPDADPLTQTQVTILVIVLLVRLVTAIWAIVIYVNTLSEVQKFSVLKTIGTIFVSAICVGIIFYLVLLLST